MGVIVPLLLIGVPLLEIAVFVMIGEHLGAAATVALVVLAAVVGIGLLRAQGLATLGRVQASLDQGRLPVAEVFDGLGLLLAGGLLVIPGFATDIVGLLLFIPAVRRALGRWLGRYLVATGRVRVDVTGRGGGRPPPPGHGPVIDGQYEDLTGEDDDENPPTLPPPAGSGR